jgi:hypothetical protein
MEMRNYSFHHSQKPSAVGKTLAFLKPTLGEINKPKASGKKRCMFRENVTTTQTRCLK